MINYIGKNAAQVGFRGFLGRVTGLLSTFTKIGTGGDGGRGEDICLTRRQGSNMYVNL